MSPSANAPHLTSVASVVAMVALSVYLLIVGESIFIPLVLAIFFTYLIVALARVLQRPKFGGHHLGPRLGLAGAIVIAVLVILLIVQLVADNVRDVVAAAPQYQDRLEGVITKVNAFLIGTFSERTTVTGLLGQLNLKDILGRLAGAMQTIAGNTLQVVIYVAFMLLELRSFDRKLTAMFTDANREQTIRATLNQVGAKIQAYVLIKTSMSLLTGVMCYVALTIIGVDFAPFWALLLFVLNFIPYIGSAIAVLLPTLLALLQFGSFLMALLVISVLMGVQAIIDNVVEPRLAGKTLNISPVVMMIGLSIWGTIWGITGMILSVPILVMVMIVLAQFPRTRPIAILMSENGDIR
jgi:predicted PurR-regulated permease PerM